MMLYLMRVFRKGAPLLIWSDFITRWEKREGHGFILLLGRFPYDILVLVHQALAEARWEMTERYFEGDLVQNEMLERIARQRRRKYHEITVLKSDLDSYLKDGWEEKTPYKRKVRLRKGKPVDELLEDEVWLLFKNMGFTEMNKDRNFKIHVGPVKKQIDVFARDGNMVFVVECKASAARGAISAKEIRELSDLRGDVFNSIKRRYKDIENIALWFVIATKGIRWSEANEALATDKKISIWKEAELEYYGRLAKHLGSAARFQIYPTLYPKPKPDPIEVPAIRGGRGKAKYYCFVIQPEKLIQVAYVHRRRGTPEELQGSYQRMVKKPRLNDIRDFINAGGYFPNNIILNFTEKPTFRRFKKEKQVGDLVVGMLEFPRKYTSAWIIDGQHRLYGFADTASKSTDTVPVLAFESLDVKEQAKLFVEINKEQKAVPANLLWDLFPDIYYDSPEEKHQLLRTISLVVKKLNSDSDSPLRDHVRIPSVTSKGRSITNLSMATVCEALKETRLLDFPGGLLYNTDYDSTVEFAAQRLKAYFDVVAKAFPEDWGKGNKGLLRTNIGIRILFMIARQLLRYLWAKGEERVYKKRDLKQFRIRVRKLFSPALSELKSMSDQQRSNIRKQTAKGLVLQNAKRMVWWINEKHRGFGLELLGAGEPPVPEEESDEHIKQLLEDTEKMLRVFAIEELKKSYNAQWYPKGIPATIKKRIDEQIKKEISKDPRQKAKLLSLPAEERLTHTTIGDLKEIIRCRSNWKLFEDIFGTDKEYASAQFTSFERLRNIYAHRREDTCDEIEKKLGYWGVKWIAKRISLDEGEEQGAKT